MQVKWLRQALRNLDEEAAYIAQDNPQSAAAFVLEAKKLKVSAGETALNTVS